MNWKLLSQIMVPILFETLPSSTETDTVWYSLYGKGSLKFALKTMVSGFATYLRVLLLSFVQTTSSDNWVGGWEIFCGVKIHKIVAENSTFCNRWLILNWSVKPKGINNMHVTKKNVPGFSPSWKTTSSSNTK